MVYSLNSYLRSLFGYSNGREVNDNVAQNKPQRTFCETINENQKPVQTENKEETAETKLIPPEEEFRESNLANNLQNSNSVNSLAFANKSTAKMLPKQNNRRRNSKRFVIGDETEEEPATNHENDFSLPVPNIEWLKSAARLKPGATLT